MSDARTDVTGLVLAGGMGRRMNGVDKGLVMLQQQQMIGWVIDTLKPNVSEVIINANRNMADYEQFAVRVVKDSIDGFQGPLAGFEAGLSLLPHMFQSVIENDAEIGVAFDGERTHPVFSLVRTDLLQSLRTYLESGERKIDRWFDQHKLLTVDCSEYAASFVNINTTEELKRAELER